jgi:hypothetical protein
VQNTLVEMAKSDLVFVQIKGKEKHYWLNKENWHRFLLQPEKQPQWVNWPPLFRAMEIIWQKLNDEKLVAASVLFQASELKELMRQVRPKIEKSGFGQALSDEKQYLGEKYTNVFLGDLERILGKL